MSIAIDSLPAAPSDGAAGAPAGTNNGSNLLPFDAILEEQTGANGQTGDVGGADEPVDVFDASALAAQAIERLAQALTTPASTTGPLPRHGDTNANESPAMAGATRKKNTAADVTALLTLMAQDVFRPVEALRAPPANDTGGKAAPGAPVHASNNDELVQRLFAALTEGDVRAVLNADPGDTHPVSTEPAPLTDMLQSASQPAPTPTPLPDFQVPHSPPAATSAADSVVDAARLSVGQAIGPAALVDQQNGFSQSSTAGFDRRGSKAAAAPAIQLTNSPGSIDTALNVASLPEPPAGVTMPNEDGVVSSLVQSMRLQMRGGIGTAVVHLEPDYLGVVSISLRVENGVVTASLHAENPQVRAWMEANTPILRESLATQGLSLDHLLVTGERIGDEPSGRRQPQEREQQARQRPRRDDAATFEVIV